MNEKIFLIGFCVCLSDVVSFFLGIWAERHFNGSRVRAGDDGIKDMSERLEAIKTEAGECSESIGTADEAVAGAIAVLENAKKRTD